MFRFAQHDSDISEMSSSEQSFPNEWGNHEIQT